MKVKNFNGLIILSYLTKRKVLTYYGADWNKKVVCVLLDFKQIFPEMGSAGTTDPLETFVFFNEGELKDNQILIIISIDKGWEQKGFKKLTKRYLKENEIC